MFNETLKMCKETLTMCKETLTTRISAGCIEKIIQEMEMKMVLQYLYLTGGQGGESVVSQ